MAADTAALTHCPTCGAVLHRTDLSLCAYCASPLQTGASVKPPSEEVLRKLAKVKSHADYEAALQWTPVEPEVERRALRLRSIGGALLFAAGLGAILGTRRIGFGVGGAALFIVGLALFVSGKRIRRRAKEEPMLRRAALVTDRRSKTEPNARVGATTYFFSLAFEDGGEGVFSFRGRGVMYEPPTVGATGVAYTRGATLIEFKRI
jgi:hypothetical protein